MHPVGDSVRVLSGEGHRAVSPGLGPGAGRRDAESERGETLLGGLQGLAALPAGLGLLEFGHVLDAALEAPAEAGPEGLDDRVFVGALGQGVGSRSGSSSSPAWSSKDFPPPLHTPGIPSAGAADA
jgi:hypothetical protein